MATNHSIQRLKTNSFRVSGPKPSNSTTHEIILISPRMVELVLETWVHKTVKQIRAEPPRDVELVLKLFSFSVSDVLEKGREALDKQIERCVLKLNKARKNADKQPSIIFIAHSLGVWVLRGALARTIVQGVDVQPLSIVLLDATLVDGQYLKYLQQLGERMVANSSNALHEQLRKRLEEIDLHYESLKDSMHISGVQDGSDVRFPWAPRYDTQTVRLEIWLSDNPTLSNVNPRRDRESLLNVVRMATSRYRDSRQAAAQSLDKFGLKDILQSMISPQKTSQPISALKAPNMASIAEEPEPRPFYPGLTMVARPPSLAMSNFGYVNEHGVLSKMSLADFPETGITPEQVKKTKDLALAFLEHGDLEDAQVLLERSLELMETMETALGTGYSTEVTHVKTHMAVILLYQGEYQRARKSLEDLRDESVQKPHEAKVVHELQRWVAIAMIYAGDYRTAASELEKLAKENLDQDILKIQILRDLALANGLKGDHRAANSYLLQAGSWLRHAQKLQNIGEETERKLQKKQWGLLYTQAHLYTLRGEYRSGLVRLQSALKQFQGRFGNAHVETLKAANLRIQLLAYTGDYEEAELQCRKMVQTMDKELGRMHPLRLETIGVLVYILHCQSRFTEALVLAKSLCEMTASVVSDSHPQTLRARSQLARAHLALGNYHTAEAEIRKTTSDAVKRLGIDNPETLRYRSEHAQALRHYGNLEDALKIALHTLFRQRVVYANLPLRAEMQNNRDSQAHTAALAEMIEEIHVHQGSPVSFEIHPDLLFTMQVVASIVANNPQPQLKDPERIFEAVVACRRSKLGSSHTLTLFAEQELGSFIRENDDEGHRLPYVNNILYHVWSERYHTFGPSHPETLSAEREVVITDCIRGAWEEGGPAKRSSLASSKYETGVLKRAPDNSFDKSLEQKDQHGGNIFVNLSASTWMDIENVSRCIVELQEPQLGPNHPEVLKSLLWLFCVQLFMQKPSETDANAAWSRLKSRLKDPSIYRERLIDVLRLEERVAGIFQYHQYYDQSREILDHVLDTIQAEAMRVPQDLQDALDSLKLDVAQKKLELVVQRK
ncbi:uncharacterized protein E0L32_004139 [Thyridium curvatum]|uniref:Uncharacterized protein n=1 Tax=Thyridium curvatum TaxID=1093900 RepID=A0A507BBW2_9PEZI|nr:uncharacterized protein E0L32_004139 [Thyridium curvatum]TPX16144.1 hypothetical protein E0L32_004139 [Thyridium curvatum]